MGVAFWEVLVSGLWQNHGTGAGGRNPVPSPLLLFPPPVSCCGHLLVLLPPHQASGGLMEQMICGSEETQDSSEGVFLGGVMLHSDQSFPGIPEQPGSTVGTGPLSAPWPASGSGASSRSGRGRPRPRTASSPARCSG